MVAVTSAEVAANGATIELTTASLEPWALHTLTVNGVKEPSAQGREIAASSQVSFTNRMFTVGYLRRELFSNLGGTNVADLQKSINFPNRPSTVDTLRSFGWPTENISDLYGARLAGYLLPPQSGAYTFALRSDDSSQLYLSSDDTPDNKTLLLREDACCRSFDANASGPVTLEAGRRYYIEGLMKEGGGPDYLYVAWKTPDNQATWVVIPGSSLGGYLAATNTTLGIAKQPTNLVGMLAGLTATFSVTVTGRSSFTTNLTYQWQRNGMDLPRATSASYTNGAVSEADDGALYRVLVSLPGRTVISSDAMLTLEPDPVRPEISAMEGAGLDRVWVRFSERMEVSSVLDAGHYSFVNGPGVIGVSLLDEKTVVLTVHPRLVEGSNYAVRVSGVRDRARVPNEIVAGSQGTFIAREFAGAQVGGAEGTTTVVAGGAADVVGGGSDIGGSSDQFQYGYQLQVGDFDLKVRVASLSLGDAWAKGG